MTAKPEPRYKNQGADRWSPIRKTNEPAPDLGFICIYRAATAIRKFIGYPYTEPFRLINSTRKLIYTSYRDNPQEIRSIYLVIVSWSTIKKALYIQLALPCDWRVPCNSSRAIKTIQESSVHSFAYLPYPIKGNPQRGMWSNFRF